MASFTRSVVVHGHFYQPPREDPWLGVLERQPEAAPFHDWNARIESECYRAVVAARILGEGGRIREIINTLRFISFNFGPTLLDWMETAAPDTYSAILEADRLSRIDHSGHGNAVAQAYHHTILPLASRREKVTEVRWGILDFRRRFRRDPLGMWLPETAVDAETLDVLAQEGVAFTIVAPHQVGAVPAGGLPGFYRTASGRSIALFVYDGSISHDVAFGSLLKDTDEWVTRLTVDPSPEATPSPEPTNRLIGEKSSGVPEEVLGGISSNPPRLVSLATDGETYGHHHRFGEMALASVIRAVRATRGVHMENFASFLAHSPPQEEVTLNEATSWSCEHGVERWQANCGCRMNPAADTQQEWRAPLRNAMEWLADQVHRRFEREATALLGNPWKARDEYGAVATGTQTLDEFLDQRLPGTHSQEDRVQAAELLEGERNALRLFTSCGWFFDDLAGLEPIQILRYAARVLELTRTKTGDFEQGFLSRLQSAESNELAPRDGATIFLEDAQPRTPAHIRVAAGVAALSREGGMVPSLPGFLTQIEERGRIRVQQTGTGRSWVLETSLEGTSPRGLRLRVRCLPREGEKEGSENREYQLEPRDLPETFRVLLEGSILRRAVDRWVPREASSELLLEGRASEEILSEALICGLRKLSAETEGSASFAEALAQVEALTLLHLDRDIPIPFDAQTLFQTLFSAASPGTRATLVSLRHNLGFVPLS